MAFSKSISKISVWHRHAFRRGSTSAAASSLVDAVSRISMGFASLLLASGVFHIGVWGFLGGEWEGDVSWRKPILFGLSAGMTLASFSWLSHRIRPTARTRLALSLLSTSLLLEVALITLQQWRGVTSHFNRSTLFDRVIDQSMTGLILLATASIVPLAVAVFRTVGLPSDLRLAVRAGIVFLFLSCFIGVIIWLHGLQRLNLGLPPAQVGTAGIPKFPHGVSIHALQLFPITCWILTKIGWPMPSRRTAIKCLVANHATLLIFSIYQTVSGRARFEMDIPALILFVLAMACLIPMIFEFFRQCLFWAIPSAGKRSSSLAE